MHRYRYDLLLKEENSGLYLGWGNKLVCTTDNCQRTFPDEEYADNVLGAFLKKDPEAETRKFVLYRIIDRKTFTLERV